MFGVAQEVGGAYFVEGLPVLGFVHCVRLQKFRFSSFRVDFFFLRTCLRHRDQSALAPIVLAFWENRGDSCAGSGQTWPVFSSGNMLVF